MNVYQTKSLVYLDHNEENVDFRPSFYVNNDS